VKFIHERAETEREAKHLTTNQLTVAVDSDLGAVANQPKVVVHELQGVGEYGGQNVKIPLPQKLKQGEYRCK